MEISHAPYGYIILFVRGEDYITQGELSRVIQKYCPSYKLAPDDINFDRIELFFNPSGQIYKKERLSSVRFDVD